MRAGETDKAVSFKDEKLMEVIKKFVSEAGYRGQIDIDVFDVNGEYYISEVNPRFGGGYPHAYESGANHMRLIVNTLADNIIVAAGSVVTKSFRNSNIIIGGNPAHIINTWDKFSEKIKDNVITRKEMENCKERDSSFLISR